MAAPGSAARRRLLSGSSRYELLVKIASGGMASVYVGRRTGAVGFSRLVAIKRAHPHLLQAAGTRQQLLAEAAHASRIHHPNVVGVRDVAESGDELLLVMDYVEGASLAELLASDGDAEQEVPTGIAVRVLLDACAGLAAVHGLQSDAGESLGLVHRDVSPQNILVGVDGAAKLSDFGLAKLTESTMTRTTGIIRGKLAYLPPEYIEGNPFTPAGDVFSMGVVIWEALANQRLFRADTQGETIRRVLGEEAPLLSTIVPGLEPKLDAVVARALEKQADRRWDSIAELSSALERAARSGDLCATRGEVGAYVREAASEALERRRELLLASSPSDAEAVMSETVSLVHGDLPIATPDEDSVDRATDPDDDGELPDDEGTITRKRPAIVPPNEALDDPETLPTELPSPIPRPGARRRRPAMLAAMAMLVLGSAFVLWTMTRHDPESAASGPAPDAPLETAAATEQSPQRDVTPPAAPAPSPAANEPAPVVRSSARATAAPRTKLAPPPAAPPAPPRSPAPPATASPITPTNPYKTRLEKL